jgi:tetratricopeptide (TPR) repeat protein
VDESIALDEYVVVHDPVNPTGHSNLAEGYLAAGRWYEAIASYDAALRLSPDRIGAHYFKGVALLLKGDAAAALAAMEQEEFEVLRLIGQVMAHHALNENESSDSILADLIARYEQDAAYNIAYVMAYRGAADEAFAWLDKAVEFGDPGLSDIVNEPLFNTIHTDPRWLPFMESIGKAPAQLDSIPFEVTLP